MSSSEEYLDSLLDSILGGGDAEESSPEKNEEAVSEENRSVEAEKAMSPAEIEEMLVSMGTLGGGEEEAAEADTAADDMEAMLAFMNEQSSAAANTPATEETAVEDISLDELPLDDLSIDETGMEDRVETDLGLEELPEGELSMDDISIDELSLDDLSMDEAEMEDSVETDLGLEELPEGELLMDDISMDELSLDDLSMGEAEMEDSVETDLGLEELPEGELPMEDMSLDELSLDDLSMDEAEMGDSIGADLGLEELPEGDMSLDDMSLDDFSPDEATTAEEADSVLEDLGDEDMDGLMSEEDIDRLLSGDPMEEGETASEDFALEDGGNGEEELSDLLAGMDHDEDLSEINDLLEESQQGVPADDDLLAMLEGAPDGDDDSFDFFESDEAAREAEGIRELSPEEVAARENNGEEKPKKEKKKRKKLFGKKKDDAGAAAEEAEDGLEDAAGQEAEKKPGLFAKLMDFLLESDEDEDPLAAEVRGDKGGTTGTVTDENQALLDELSEEDKKGKKKKKKEKKKKDKGEAKEKKPKKPKKEKKKKVPEEDPYALPEKKLSKKKVFTAFLLGATIGAGIIVMNSYLPDYLQIQDAHVAYDNNDYAEVYELLYAVERSEQDEILFQRSNLILQMRRKVASYENYINLNMRLEALNALISGVERYQQVLPKAEQYNVVDEVSTTYSQILGLLTTEFGVSESEALEIIALKDNVEYTKWLERILNGSTYSEEEGTSATLDILPEEEEILERLEGLQEEQQDIMPDEAAEIDAALPEEELEIDGNWDEGSEE
ncbi:MAG: hypothetical protein HDR05_09390 [Lachnospiraceae bacterium]|nr:hypothetical protein [Lachnospiraceae bacterium]